MGNTGVVPASAVGAAAINKSLPALAFQSAAPAATPACWAAVAAASGASESGVHGSKAIAGPPAAGASAQPVTEAAAAPRAKTRSRNGKAGLELRAKGRRNPNGAAAAGSEKSELKQRKNAEKRVSWKRLPGISATSASLSGSR